MALIRRSFFVSLTMLCLCADASSVRAKPVPLTYEKDIRPILRAHCFDCHGATERVKGKLDLRLVRWMKKGGRHGPAIVPGQPEKSYLLKRIRKGEMPPGEKIVPEKDLRTIERWIAAGAATARPEPVSLAPGLGITPEERSFWSFQPIQRPAVPAPSSFPPSARIRAPIDALILAAAPNGSVFSPDADRRTLIKRAYFNLIGLPPTPKEMAQWLSAPGEQWFEAMLDQLLASPHYGERWGRHWLDAVGYADSEGYTSDNTRPWAWKYRDYVIASLNADKPWDRFITEQLAGDEIAGAKKGEWKPRQIELLTATGFLRMAADNTGSGGNNAAGRNQVMTDTLKIVGTGLLGLSLHCAQCHDHRYDPIPQTDYYAIRAVFEPALDWKAWKVPNARRVSLYTEADRKKARELDAEAQKIAQEKAKKQSEYMKKALEKELTKFDESLREPLRKAYQTPANKRTKEQNAILAKYPSVNISPGVLYQYLPEAAKDLKKYDERIRQARAKKPKEQFLRALVEPTNHVTETKLFHRGDPEQPKQTVLPGPLTVTQANGKRPFAANDPSRPTTGRRLAFAQWLTDRSNPLFARVLANRIWMHHFGRGLVATAGDFGKLGTTPSHSRLLDWLANELMRQNWSLKRFHRLIMTSTVWRQSCKRRSGADQQLASLYLRKPLVRLEAEILRDRLLATTGELSDSMKGPPIAIKEDDTGQVIVSGGPRRSVYIQARRSRPVSLLKAFDAPVMQTNCEQRANSTVATQSLMLLNHRFVLERASKLAERILQIEKEPKRQIQHCWEMAFCRPPTKEETAIASAFLAKQTKKLEAKQALTNLCHTLFCSNEFLYVE